MIEPADVQYLKRHLHANNVVVFLGAGFSTAAKNSAAETLPGSRGLAEKLWAYMEYSTPYDGSPLGIVYQAALNKPGGRKNLFELLARTLTVTEFPDWYRLITNFFWYRIYTTNVDDLAEEIYQNGGPSGLDRVVAPAEYEDRDAFLRSIQLVKLNGSIDDDEKGLTFTPIEYGRRAAEQDVWYDHLVRDICTHPTLFIGSELDEPLFWQYLALRQRRAKGSGKPLPKSFLVCPEVSIVKREALAEFNIVPIEMMAENFFTQLASEADVVISRESLLRKLDPTIEEILALESAGVPSQEIELAEEFFSVFRPAVPQPRKSGTRSHFLLGSPPSWADIFNELDAEREVNRQVARQIIEDLEGEHNGDGFVILTGAAGSGKTTIAKRVSLMISNEGYPVYYSTNFARLMPERVVAYLRNYERRVVLVFDETADDLRRIRELSDACRDLPHRPVILLTIRTNELAVRRYIFQGVDDLVEIRVPDLSDPDISAILDKLEQNSLLGELRKLKRGQQVDVFRTKAKKQILVAMREATRGKGFDEIIQDEYDQITPEHAKLVYLIAAIPSMHHYFIDRGQLIAAMSLSPSETSGIIDDTLSGILIPHESNPSRLQIRHPVIAEYVVNKLATREFLAQAYILFLEILAHDLPRQKNRRGSKVFRLYQNVINHVTIHTIFLKQVNLCREIYESIKPHFTDDGHYFLQYGAYELEWGDLDFAENYLLQAESLMPYHPWVATSLGYLWMRQGVEASSPLAATEYLNKGVERIQHQIETVGRKDPYPYHILGSQMLAFINRWVLKEEKAEKLQELHTRVAEGSNRHPLDHQLKNLVESIKRAELTTAISS